VIAVGDELREASGRIGNRAGPGDPENVKAFALCIGRKFGFRGGGI
jgi:hypothetical protein